MNLILLIRISCPPLSTGAVLGQVFLFSTLPLSCWIESPDRHGTGPLTHLEQAEWWPAEPCWPGGAAGRSSAQRSHTPTQPAASAPGSPAGRWWAGEVLSYNVWFLKSLLGTECCDCYRGTSCIMNPQLDQHNVSLSRFIMIYSHSLIYQEGIHFMQNVH